MENLWFLIQEEAALYLITKLIVISGNELGGLVDIDSRAGGKYIFIILIPRDKKFLSIYSIISINKGDFLGVFTRYLRFLESFDNIYGIYGPIKNL